jgi:hypothetical protein
MNDEHFLYAITTGWKSGNPHEIEIWFVAHHACFYMVAEMLEKTHWVQNIRHNPAVRLFVGSRTERKALTDADWRPATGRIVDPLTEPELTAQVQALMNQKYNWSTGIIAEIKPEQS